MADSSDSDLETELSAAEVLRILEQAWQNEKFSPELLPPKTDMIENMLELIRSLEENISLAPKGDLFTSVQKLELDRVRFIICSYLRIRLQKIERHVWHVLEQESDSGSPSRLSPNELVYAKEFASNLDSHLSSVALKHMPLNLQQIDKKKAVPRPSLDNYVFIKGVEKSENVVVGTSDSGDTQTIDIDTHSQFIVPYRSVSKLVQDDAVRLI